MDYRSKLSLFETQKAIRLIDLTFEDSMFKKFNFTPVSLPLFVDTFSGLDDGVVGFERPLTFDLKSGMLASIGHTKWKRQAMKDYDFEVNTGMYGITHMERKEEDLDPIHSHYVDQYEWEMVIQEEDRTIEFLKSVVRSIYECMRETEEKVVQKYPVLSKKLPREIAFTSALDLEDAYPALRPQERETKHAEKHGAVFIAEIGSRMKSGEIHSKRAADSDDWELNGDIVVHYPPLDRAIELSSMGIRVDKDSLVSQLKQTGELDQAVFPFHKAILNGELPLTVGGGIGRSRLIMYLLDKLHIGEVQVSLWNRQIVEECKAKNIKLL